jgi:hypothetical protein
VIVRDFVDRLCKALCPDLIRGRRIWRGARRSPVLVELALWLCAQEQRNVRSLKTNKEEEEVGGRSPTLG